MRFNFQIILFVCFFLAIPSRNSVLAEENSSLASAPTFDAAEIQILHDVFENKDFNFDEFDIIIKNLPKDLLEKIKNLGASESSLYNSNDLALFNEHHKEFTGFNKLILVKIFIHTLALEVIDIARTNKNYALRLLARDMGPIYRHAEWLLQQEDGSLKLSVQERLDILRRIDYVYASRNMINSLQNFDQIKALFNIDTNSEMKYILLDAGYLGSIPKTLAPYLQSMMNEGSLEWRFIWKSPDAPNYIGIWGQKFFNKIAKLFPNYDTQGLKNRSEAGSFRVALFEHLPKTLGSFNQHSSQPVYLMLDLDDTVLKEVDYKKYGLHPNVQSLNYSPSPEAIAKYRERLNSPADAQKVIHYDFGPDNSFKSTVTVRPGFEFFLKSIEGYIQTGDVRIIVTSNNDFERTKAALKQLKINGATLEERGALLFSPDSFNNKMKNKDMSYVRRLAGIDNSPILIAIDDLPDRVQKSTANDYIFPVTAFAETHVEQALHQETQFNNLLLEDMWSMKRLVETVRRQLILTKEITIQEKIRGFAFLFEVFSSAKDESTQKTPAGSAASMCRQIFKKGAP